MSLPPNTRNELLPSIIRGLSEAETWDYENGFYWFSHPTRIYKLLAHYELYRQITKLPGDVFELGVFKAASMIRFATFRALLENNYSRKIIGFDFFSRFPIDKLKLRSDHEFVSRFEAAGATVSASKRRARLFSEKVLIIFCFTRAIYSRHCRVILTRIPPRGLPSCI